MPLAAFGTGPFAALANPNSPTLLGLCTLLRDGRTNTGVRVDRLQSPRRRNTNAGRTVSLYILRGYKIDSDVAAYSYTIYLVLGISETPKPSTPEAISAGLVSGLEQAIEGHRCSRVSGGSGHLLREALEKSTKIYTTYIYSPKVTIRADDCLCFPGFTEGK